jgi:Raf kinase inhibitor-like YbhB/YbcL family protein
MKKILFSIVVCATLLSACSPAVPNTPTVVPTSIPTSLPTETPAPTATSAPTFVLSSSAFANDESIPVIYTCNGKRTSPAFAWTEPPAGTQSFALIVNDPDAGNYVHWVLYNIPATQRSLPDAVQTGQELDDGMYQGLSGGAVFGYVGPCPPSGMHHYSFTLYALDFMLKKEQGVGRNLLLDAIKGHILAQSELIGTYKP